MALVHVIVGLVGAFLVLTGLSAVANPGVVKEGFASTDAGTGAASVALALSATGWRLAGAVCAAIGAVLVYWAVA